jgi:hypothetical protein
MAKVKHTGISLKIGLGTIVVLTHLPGRNDASYVEGTASEKTVNSNQPLKLSHPFNSPFRTIRTHNLTDRTTLLFLAMLPDFGQAG